MQNAALPVEPYLTTADLARATGQTPGTWAKRRWRGDTPAFSVVGNKVLYKRSDVEEWLAQRRVTSTADAQARGLAPVPANKKRAVPAAGAR